jgi:hypothetical protein
MVNAISSRFPNFAQGIESCCTRRNNRPLRLTKLTHCRSGNYKSNRVMAQARPTQPVPTPLCHFKLGHFRFSMQSVVAKSFRAGAVLFGLTGLLLQVYGFRSVPTVVEHPPLVHNAPRPSPNVATVGQTFLFH